MCQNMRLNSGSLRDTYRAKPLAEERNLMTAISSDQQCIRKLTEIRELTEEETEQVTGGMMIGTAMVLDRALDMSGKFPRVDAFLDMRLNV
jgi:hypothetical protein